MSRYQAYLVLSYPCIVGGALCEGTRRWLWYMLMHDGKQKWRTSWCKEVEIAWHGDA